GRDSHAGGKEDARRRRRCDSAAATRRRGALWRDAANFYEACLRARDEGQSTGRGGTCSASCAHRAQAENTLRGGKGCEAADAAAAIASRPRAGRVAGAHVGFTRAGWRTLATQRRYE